MSEEIEWWEFDNAEEMADAVSGDIAFIIESAMDARGQALLAFPGGSTPTPIYEQLVAAKLKWKGVTIVPTDDRLVAVNNPLSNIAAIAKRFLPLGARVVPLASEAAEDRHKAGVAAGARLGDLHWPPDLVWLGMGADGHTASIFPGPDLEEALAPKAKGTRAVGVLPEPLPPEAPVTRVTLTAPAIAEARTVVITISGAEKRKVLEQALKDGAKSQYPIGRVFAQLTVPVDIYWSK